MEFQDMFFDPQEQNFPDMDADIFWHETSIGNESLEFIDDMGGFLAYEDDYNNNNNNNDCTPFDSTYNYYDHEGNILNLSSYEVLGCYDFSGNVTNTTTTVSIPEGRFVAIALFVILFVVGIVGNALVISTVFRFGSMRKVTYLYLMNLAAADLLYLLVCLPTLTASYAMVEWPFGLLFCRLENYLMSVSMSVSVLTIVATSLDRYLAVLYPVRSRPLRTTKIALVVIGTVWVVSLVLLSARIPLFDIVPVYDVVRFTKRCERSGSQRELKTDTVLVFMFLYLLPLIVLTLCHFEIGRRLWRSQRPGIRLASVPRDSQGGTFGLRERRRIARIMMVITVVFGLGWLPVHLYHLVEDFDEGNVLLGEYLDRGMVALFFSFGANSLNPFFYCVFSSTFRKNFKQAFLCWKQTPVPSMGQGLSRRVDVQHRTPVVLLPRPASILPSPSATRDEFPLGLEPLLGGNAIRAKNPLFDLSPAASPLSVEELTGIRVSDSEQPATPGKAANARPPPPRAPESSHCVQELIAVETLASESKVIIPWAENLIAVRRPSKNYLKHVPYSQPVTTTKSSTASSKRETKNKSHTSEGEYICIEKQRNLNATCQNQTPTVGMSMEKEATLQNDQSKISNTGSFYTHVAKDSSSGENTQNQFNHRSKYLNMSKELGREDQSSKSSLRKWKDLVNEINLSGHRQRGHKLSPCPVLKENMQVLNLQVQYEGSPVKGIYELNPASGSFPSRPLSGILKIHESRTSDSVSSSNPLSGTDSKETSRLDTDVDDVPSFSEMNTKQMSSWAGCPQSHAKVKAQTTTTTHGSRRELSLVAEMTTFKESSFVPMPDVD